MTIQDFPQQVQDLLDSAKALVYECFDDVVYMEPIVEEDSPVGTPMISLKIMFSGDMVTINKQFDTYQEKWGIISPPQYTDMIALQFDIKTEK